jgi:hypothetical protein
MVWHHTSASRVGIYVDRAMTEHIAHTMVRSLVLSLSPERFEFTHIISLHL